MTSSYPQNFGSGSTPKKSFGAGGCQALSDGRKCGETKNLQIIHEFKRLYENKMKQIDDAAGGDCVQAKISLQQEWIRDLTDQNEMLVKVVEELEVEAAERVTMLEDKLQHTAKCACESEKLAKDKDKKVKELEEQLKKLKEVAEKNEEAQKSCQKYAELKKDNEKDSLFKKLCSENSQLCVQVKTLKGSIDKMKNTLQCKNPNCHKNTQTTSMTKQNSTQVADEFKCDNPKCLKNTQTSRTMMRHTSSQIEDGNSQASSITSSRLSNFQPRERGVYPNTQKDAEFNKILIGKLDAEVQKVLSQARDKDKQLKEITELIRLVVQKLFCVYQNLRRLDSETSIMVKQLENSCRCDTGETIEKYEIIIQTLQVGLRESVKGIEYENKH